MRIASAEFVAGADSLDRLPPKTLPEIAFAGRSNVGKSSLINCLVNRRRLALASSTPGRTRAINFYRINDSMLFVDLPGYGFSRMPKSQQRRLVPLIERYIRSGRPSLVVGIIDARRPPEPSDLLLFRWLQRNNVNYVIAATKADKISRSKHKAAQEAIAEAVVGLDAREIVLFSSRTRLGRDRLWKLIARAAV